MAEVFGLYSQRSTGCYDPVFQGSHKLFIATVLDDINTVVAEVASEPSLLNRWHLVLHCAQQHTAPGEMNGDQHANHGSLGVSFKSRTLTMIAAAHASLRVLSYLLSRGSDPSVVAPDVVTARTLAASSMSPHTPTVCAMLDDARALAVVPNDAAPGRNTELDNDPYNQDVPYSTTELTRPEYSTDTFRLYHFKVLPCSKKYAHDWRACPFAHPTENARRRDPREYSYRCTPCPDYKQGFCVRGDACTYAHGVFECWLHPARYRTQLCKDCFTCRRPVCFFAHSLAELRAPVQAGCKPPTDELSCRPVGATSPPGPAARKGLGGSGLLQPQISLTSTSSTRSSCASLLDLATHPAVGQHLLSSELSGEDMSVFLASSSSGYSGQSSPDHSANLQAHGGIMGLPAPRMSNAFARKHGLNPKDDPMVNMQKIALSQLWTSSAAAAAPSAARKSPPAPLFYPYQQAAASLMAWSGGYVPDTMPSQAPAVSVVQSLTAVEPALLTQQLAALSCDAPGAYGYLTPVAGMF